MPPKARTTKVAMNARAATNEVPDSQQIQAHPTVTPSDGDASDYEPEPEGQRRHQAQVKDPEGHDDEDGHRPDPEDYSEPEITMRVSDRPLHSAGASPVASRRLPIGTSKGKGRAQPSAEHDEQLYHMSGGLQSGATSGRHYDYAVSPPSSGRQTPYRAPPLGRNIDGALTVSKTSPKGSSNETFLQNLIEELFEMENRGTPESEILKHKKRIEYCSTMFGLNKTASPAAVSASYNEAGKLIRTLNAIQPKPSLGTSGRAPTPGQVEQWVKDMSTAFAYAQVLEDSTTRTHWAMGTVHYSVHRELIQQAVTTGTIQTWDQLVAEQRKLVQDPVLTRYDTYHRLFNFEWRDTDTVNNFLLQLEKKVTALGRNFFLTLTGKLDDELKIAFVWARTPEPHRREIMRSGVLRTIVLWAEFERALRNAETAVTADPALSRGKPGDGHHRGKRDATSPRPAKDFNKRLRPGNYQGGYQGSNNNGVYRPNNVNNTPQGRQAPNGGPAKGNASGNQYNDRANRNENSGGNGQKDHWKVRYRDDSNKTNQKSTNELGKDKP
jgi:hypothetical protein